MKKEILFNDILNKLYYFQNQNPDIYIGGSISLILQNIIPLRIPKDIDIISPIKIHISDIFSNSNKHKLVRKYKHDNLIYELFYNPEAKYIEYIWDNKMLKISPIDEICEWKLRKENIMNEKHLTDLIEIYNGL